MNERGIPHHVGYRRPASGHRGDSFEASTVRLAPADLTETATAVGLLERPAWPDADEQSLPGHGGSTYPAQDHPSFPPGALSITPEDLYEVLGADTDDLLADTDVDVDELIRMINAETTVMPPLVLPDTVADLDDSEEPPPEVVEAIGEWKRRFLKGAVTAVVLTLTGAGGAAAAMDKSVTVEVDGAEREIHTYGSSVSEVLSEEGIEVDSHDALSPSPQSEIEHGDVITLDRGRLLTLTVDGEQREEWVRSVTVGQALRQLGVPTDGAWVSAKRTMPVPEQGMTLEVKTSKSITLINGGSEPEKLTTTAVTVDELLRQEGIKLGAQDSVTPGSGQLSDGTVVRIDQTGTSTVNVREPIEPPVKEIVDDTMFQGERTVEEPGKPGEKIVFYRVTTRNGAETDREQVGERVLQEAEPKVVRVGGKPRPNSGVWDKLAQCESGGNWQINTGNGYYGGLQFNKQTWDAYGGDQYAAYPHQASREQQIAVATKMRDARGGYGAWPSCSSQLGLS
ncbi:uncharacterized protein YabE (DUF348 family) [Halopolyspora algeriensis]|uniref:Uncharacterized protein YabE (DUF348 family) n=1 Tax=Halopolyspora algeriensis TaxID=1500506 RepID=A0A368VFD9_9ACTN|nr:resuscitation-promoting factor [Halopolyspora algeriensis]RCW39933.1 uncharacterized protein YabE (DUF348 family) [Halopolyspora algeriensis]TQM46630.1 uncharacterized protein YabE (DUF348 family) [Halopolyspora algeriensis]